MSRYNRCGMKMRALFRARFAVFTIGSITMRDDRVVTASLTGAHVWQSDIWQVH